MSKEIEGDHKLIAKFMGYKYYPYSKDEAGTIY